MQLRARTTLATLALATGLAVAPTATPAYAADPVSSLKSGGVPYVVFVVKDLGGGAYWNVTTSSLYAIQTGSEVLVSSAQTTADLLATLAANGRDLLLLVNGAVLKPVTGVLGG